MEKRNKWYPFLTKNVQPIGPALIGGKGAVVKDRGGKEYLDFSSQTLNLNLGQNHPLIIQAVREAAERITFISSRFVNPDFVKLGKRLVELAPEGLTRINLKLTNGSDANESAFKRVRKKHKKSKIISFYSSHLGETGETLSASGKHFGKGFLGGSEDFLYVSPPHDFEKPLNKKVLEQRSLSSLKRILEQRNDIAGIIIEPVMVNAGVIILSREYLEELRSICDQYQVALIFDEIQTASGWLGTMFAAEHFGVTPDLLTMGKALSAGYPLAGILMRPEYDVLDYGEDEFTYGGHPLSCSASLANLKILTTTDILAEVKRKANLIKIGLKKLQRCFTQIKEIRGIGLIWAFDFRQKEKGVKLADRVYDACLARGLILRKSCDGQGTALVLKPPLVIQEQEIKKALGILERVLKEILSRKR